MGNVYEKSIVKFGETVYLGQNRSKVKKDLKSKANFTLRPLFLSTIAKLKWYRVE